MRTVQKHVAHVMQKQINDSLSRSTRGNRFVKFTAKPLGNPSFRWVAGQYGN